MRITQAGPPQVPGITAIYNDVIERTTAIWQDVAVEEASRAEWLEARRRAGLPVLVALDEADEVLGYASFGPWRDFAGYRHTVEHSIHVRAEARGRGVGRRLLAALIDRAREQGYHVMVAAIEAHNLPSIRLHESLGFVPVGMLPQVGAKFGTWLDLAFLQLILDDRASPHAP